MTKQFEELDYCRTPIGELTLRRRRPLSLDGVDVFEVKLDNDFLMSSLVNDSEIALAELALAELDADEIDVVVAGLGLGYTARAALDQPAVRSVLVVECLVEVIDWHRRGLVPLGAELTADRRCRLINGDFFAMLNAPGQNLDPQAPGKRFHAMLVDIDHSPRRLLHEGHGPFYELDGLRRVASHLLPGGVFALWSADPPDKEFLQKLDRAFERSKAHVVEFRNPLLNYDDLNTVYVARKPNPTSPSVDP
ncbi:MAG: spermidine synthase [Thermodesulfobacteriota bacterium]|nr:spermidine synthase [Thermodesulfobacteriota bacterium]